MGRRYDTISFLSDLGLTDEHVGVAKAIVRDLAPHAVVVDLTHAIPPYDVRAGSLALARATVNAAAPDAAEQLRELTQGGVEFAFEMAGAARALELAYRITARGGTTVSAGLSHPDQRFSQPHLGLVADERTLRGSYLGSCVPPATSRATSTGTGRGRWRSTGC